MSAVGEKIREPSRAKRVTTHFGVDAGLLGAPADHAPGIDAGVNHYFVESASPLPAGEHQVRMEFAYAGGGLGKGGQVTLYVDGKKVGEGVVPMTQAMVFSADDGCDVGGDSGAPVSPYYGSRGNAYGPLRCRLTVNSPASSASTMEPSTAVRARSTTAISPWRRKACGQGTSTRFAVSAMKPSDFLLQKV